MAYVKVHLGLSGAQETPGDCSGSWASRCRVKLERTFIFSGFPADSKAASPASHQGSLVQGRPLGAAGASLAEGAAGQGQVSREQMAHLLCGQRRLEVQPAQILFLLSSVATDTLCPPWEVMSVPAKGPSRCDRAHELQRKSQKSESVKVKVFYMTKSTMSKDGR